MPRIFVSHAARNEPLVEEFVELLQVGVGIHPDEVFCSSLPGMNIPTGKAFVEHIKGQVRDPKVVLLLISQEFLKSQFCLNEVGASWALNLPIYPLLLPPLDYNDVRGVLAGIQAAKLDDKEKLNDLRDDLTKKLALTPLSTSHWERKRDRFLAKLTSLPPDAPTKIERSPPISGKRVTESPVVASSGTWLKLGDHFFEAEWFERHGKSKISIRAIQRSPEDEAALEHLRSFFEGRNNTVDYAYQNDGGLARIDRMSSVSQAGANHWAIEVTIAEESSFGFMAEMGFNQYSGDDIAEMRAGRLLINNPPPPRKRSVGTTDSHLESIIAGQSDSPAKTGECIIRQVVHKYRTDLQQALAWARLEAVFRLKAARIIGSVFELTLGPLDGDQLHVQFGGKRPRRNQAEEPETITIKGQCDLG